MLERSASGDSTEPRRELGLVTKLVPVLTRVKESILSDVLGAGAGTKRTAKGREILRKCFV